MEIKLLVRPKPFEFESLSNYMLRLEELNRCKYEWLKEAFDIKPVKRYSDSYDIYIEPKSIELIASATNTSFEEIKELTINRFNIWDLNCNYYFNASNLKDHAFAHNENSDRFCPICFKKDNYDRIYWKLKYIHVCILHNTELINHCTNCGKEITYNEFINRTCSCGTKLEDMLPTIINNEYVLNNQRRLYSWFNILKFKQDTNIKNFEIFNDFKYIDLVSPLYDIVKYHIDYFREKNLYDIENNNSNSIQHLEIVEKVIINWPQNFYKFIDNLNSFFSTDAYYNKSLYFYEYTFNPVTYLISFKIRSKLHVRMVEKELYSYFYDNYNFEFFSNVLKPSLRKYYYIEERLICSIFNIPYDFIRLKFTCIEIERAKYVNLQQVVNFFKDFIRHNNFGKSHTQIDLKSLYYSFVGLGISFDEILNIIKSKNIDITIDINENGGNMLCVSKNTAEICILEYLLNERKGIIYN